LQAGTKSGDGQKATLQNSRQKRAAEEEKRREEKRREEVNKEGSEQWRTKTKFSTVL
jgi:hypothetical protein